MEDTYSEVFFSLIERNIKHELLKIHSIIEIINTYLYVYDNVQQKYTLTMNKDTILNLVILCRDRLENITDEELETIAISQNINSIIENLHKNLKEKYLTNDNATKLLNLMQEQYIKDIIDVSIKNTVEEAIRDNYSKFYSMLDAILSLIVSQHIQVCKSQTIKYELYRIDRYKPISSTHDLSIITGVIHRTIRQALKDIKANNENNENIRVEYENFIFNVEKIWTKAIYKREPNNVYTAFNNLLNYHTTKDNKLDSLYKSIYAGYSVYKKSNNKNETLIIILIMFLDTNSPQNINRYDSIRKLATASYDDNTITDNRILKKYDDNNKIMDNRTFKKYAKKLGIDLKETEK